MMKKFAAILTALGLLCAIPHGAQACTMLYVGGALTEDGGTYFARSEDFANSQDKIFYLSPAGNHKAGETYRGCFGFSYVFLKDSYAYTAFREDNLSGICPVCGGTYAHTPYEEAGTNEMGVTVTATVTLMPNSAVSETDPFTDRGICETEIATILLSQAATAREALDILTGLYDTIGAAEGAGIILADQQETWYIENCSGTQYLALRLPRDLIFLSPNISVIGRIDLDDENVVASAGLIEMAQASGSFIGSAEEHIIDFRASYSDYMINQRLVRGIGFLNAAIQGEDQWPAFDFFTISNVKEGRLTSLYTGLKADRVIGIRDMVDFYKTPEIANPANQEEHIFQIDARAGKAKGVVEWVGMGHGAYGVMIPHYPLLLSDAYAGYRAGTNPAVFSAEPPETSAPWYPDPSRGEAGYWILPENWADSYYWSFDAVSNYVLYVDDACRELARDAYADLQEEIYAAYAGMRSMAAAWDDEAVLTEKLTAASAALAQKAHETAVALYGQISSR